MKQKPFNHRVVEAVLAGASTADEVLARIGRYLSAAQGQTAYRRHYEADRRCRPRETARPTTRHRAIEIGKRHRVHDSLRYNARVGNIRRVGRGRYAPPLPKLHEAV